MNTIPSIPAKSLISIQANSIRDAPRYNPSSMASCFIRRWEIHRSRGNICEASFSSLRLYSTGSQGRLNIILALLCCTTLYLSVASWKTIVSIRITVATIPRNGEQRSRFLIFEDAFRIISEDPYKKNLQFFSCC